MSIKVAKDDVLPNKLGELLQHALMDLDVVEASSDYEIDMARWHRYTSRDGKCHVCLAGSILAYTYRVGKDFEILVDEIHPDIYRKFLAIDALREGNVWTAYRYLNPGTDMLVSEFPVSDRWVVPYEENNNLWQRQMGQLEMELMDADL